MEKSKIILADLVDIGSQLSDVHSKFEGSTMLITGGAGFLGRYLVSTIDYLNRNVLSSPCKVILVDNFITGHDDWIPKSDNIVLMRHDISKKFEISEKVDYIIHAASIASPVAYYKHRLETIDVGILGTKNVLELAKEKDVKSILFTSSSEIYGNPDAKNIPTSEDYWGYVSCTGPRACYDEPKRIGETLCVNYSEIYGLPVKIARPFNIFGPGMRLNDGRVVSNFVVAALRGNELPVYGAGTNTRTFCYISNATVGFFKILFSNYNGEAFNIGHDYPEIEMRQLADIVQGLVENDDATVNIRDGPSDVYTKSNPDRRCPDLTKIRTFLGYNPRVNLISGLKKYIEWVKEELEKENSKTSQLVNADEPSSSDLSDNSNPSFGVKMENNCRLCNGELKKFISLGKSPLANNLLSESDLSKSESMHPLEVAFCESCYNCQLNCIVDRDVLFKHYHYVSSTGKSFREHFERMARSIKQGFNLGVSSLVVDIGSNDGVLLKPFSELGVRVLGVEPAENIVGIARENGVDTICDYFNDSAVEKIISSKGYADVVTANNVFAHTEDIVQMTKDVKRLLKPEGVFIVEAQYVLDTINDLTFDNIYHEHIHYFSALCLVEFFKRQGMQVFKIEHVDTHGGSIRVYAQKDSGTHRVDASVASFLQKEMDFGLDRFDVYEKFGHDVMEIKRKVREYLVTEKQRGKVFVGYGAPAKATTFLNFCGIDHNYIDFVVDDNPLKKGKIIPGVRIPIKGREALETAGHDEIVILAWNFANEIIRNNIQEKERGVRFVVPSPNLRVV